MRRREFITVIGGAATWPLAARAQQPEKTHRIGFLGDNSDVLPDGIAAFRRGLRDLGYVEGRTVDIAFRWAEGRPERMRALARELVALKVDVLVVPTSIYTAAARQATTTIPIVFITHADPLGSKHVASLARPGGNATGLSLMMTETNVKGAELLKEVHRGLARLAVVFDPATPSHRPGLAAIQAAAPSMQLEVQPVPVRSPAEYGAAFSAMTRDRADAVVVLATPMFNVSAKALAELALAHKLPSLFGARYHVEVGGFMSYGPDRPDLYRRAAIYVDKVLKGLKAEELPVEQPTKFELVINLKTAKAIGLTVAPAFILRADVVIE